MDDSPGTIRSGNLRTYVQLQGEYRGCEHMERIGRQLGLRQAYWQLRRIGMAMLFCLPAGWMLLAGLASGNLVYCLGGIGILYYYYFRVHLDSAGMARVEYFMQNARHYLLDKGLLVELLQADKPEWLLEQDRSLELARLKAKERPSFTDTIQRLEFLVEHYALICDERGWQWRGDHPVADFPASCGQRIHVLDIERGQALADALGELVFVDEVAESLCRGGEAARDGYTQPVEVPDHFTEGSVLAADFGEVGKAQILQPADVDAHGRSPVRIGAGRRAGRYCRITARQPPILPFRPCPGQVCASQYRISPAC